MTQHLPGRNVGLKTRCWGLCSPRGQGSSEEGSPGTGALMATTGRPGGGTGRLPLLRSRRLPALALLQVEADELLHAPAVLELRGAAARQGARLARGRLRLSHLLRHARQTEPGGGAR